MSNTTSVGSLKTSVYSEKYAHPSMTQDQSLLVKVTEGKQTDYFVQTSRKEIAKGEIHIIVGMFLNVLNSKLQVDADSETKCAHKHTARPADEKKN